MVKDALIDNRHKHLDDISSEDHKARVHKNALPDIDSSTGKLRSKTFTAQLVTQYRWQYEQMIAVGCSEVMAITVTKTDLNSFYTEKILYLD
jgi:hypothetical protein